MKTVYALMLALILLPTMSSAQIEPRYKDRPYASINGKDLLLDIYVPEVDTRPCPVVIWIHGGAWVSGNKSNPPASNLIHAGFFVVSINYRLSGEAIWPAQIYDCKAAVRWVRAHGAEYGMDLNHIGVWGSSAGGHLVAMLGSSGGITNLEGDVGGNTAYSSNVQAVCDWFGPANFLTICDYPSNLKHCDTNSPESMLLGCTLPECPEKATEVSPITYVSSDDPPILIMHGDQDNTVPYHQSVELDLAYQAIDHDCTFLTLQGAGHGGAQFNSQQTITQVTEFFNQHLKTPQAIQAESMPELKTYFSDNRLHLSFALTEASNVHIALFDLQGRQVKSLYRGALPSEEQKLSFEAKELSSGVYWVRVKGENQKIAKKVEVVR
jgi:acetyl esterase/lipase